MQTTGGYECATCGDGLNIVGIIEHDCDEVLSVESLSHSEQSTLMYVEVRMVDHLGELDPEQMNHEDRQNLKLFAAAGLLDVAEGEGSRIESRSGPNWMDKVTKFTDRAWDLARDCRKARSERRRADE